MRALIFLRAAQWRDGFGRIVLCNPGTIAKVPLGIAAAAVQLGAAVGLDDPMGAALQRRVLAGKALVTGRSALAADRIIDLGDLSRPRRRRAA